MFVGNMGNIGLLMNKHEGFWASAWDMYVQNGVSTVSAVIPTHRRG